MASNLVLRGLLGFALAGVAAVPARAQFFGYDNGPGYYDDNAAQAPAPRVIERRLARQGWRLAGPMRFNGDVVVANAVDGNGRRARLVIDPLDGSILQRFATVEPRPPGPLAPRGDNFGAPRGDSYGLNSGDEDPLAARGPSSGFLEDGSPAAPLSSPSPRVEPRAAKPKSKVVARTSPTQRLPDAAVAPLAAKPASRAAVTPNAAPPDVNVARTAPAEVSQPKVTVAPAKSLEPTPPAVAAAQPVAAAAPKASAPPKPAAATSAPASAKPGFKTGVPLNPLD